MKVLLSVVAIGLAMMAGCKRMTPLTHDPVFDAQYIKTRVSLTASMTNMRTNGGVSSPDASSDVQLLIDDMNPGAPYWEDEHTKVMDIITCRVVELTESMHYARQGLGPEPDDVQSCIDNGKVK